MFQGSRFKLELADRSMYTEHWVISTFLDNKVDSMTRTIRMREPSFDNAKDAGLASGLYASVRIPVAVNKSDLTQREAILVPADASAAEISAVAMSGWWTSRIRGAPSCCRPG